MADRTSLHIVRGGTVLTRRLATAAYYGYCTAHIAAKGISSEPSDEIVAEPRQRLAAWAKQTKTSCIIAYFYLLLLIATTVCLCSYSNAVPWVPCRVQHQTLAEYCLPRLPRQYHAWPHRALTRPQAAHTTMWGLLLRVSSSTGSTRHLNPGRAQSPSHSSCNPCGVRWEVLELWQCWHPQIHHMIQHDMNFHRLYKFISKMKEPNHEFICIYNCIIIYIHKFIYIYNR